MNCPVARRPGCTIQDDSSLDTFLAQLARGPQPLGLESDIAFPPSEEVLLPSHEVPAPAERRKHRTQVIEPQVRPGSSVGPYRLTRELGRGGMGVVFQAEDPDGRPVALKLILTLDHPRHLARFEREGQITAALDHAGIVRIHGAGEHHGMPYLVYELVEGAQTLDDVFERYDLSDRAGMVRDAARALGHAHERGVVHRDVKPENILLDIDGRVRVADFGLAEGRGLKRLTREGTFLGTPGFAAPEQLTGRWMQIGPHSDVWSLGAVLYFLFTGRLPFNGRTFNELAHRTTTGVVRAPSKFAPDLDPALEEVCLKALSRNPKDRYADGAELADDLDRALSGEPLARPNPRPRRAQIVAGAAALLVLSAAGAFARAEPARIDLLPTGAWSAEARLAGNVVGTPIHGVTLTVDGEAVPLTGARFDARLDRPEGQHQVELVLRRNTTVLARERCTLLVDRTPPTVTLSGPRPDKIAPDGKVWISGRVEDLTDVRVGVVGGPQTRVASGQSFSLPLSLAPGRNTIELKAIDAAGNATTRSRTVWVPPEWYMATPAARRAPLPLPNQVTFGDRPGEYRHTGDGSVLVWVWLQAPEALFQADGAGPPRNFQMRAGPFVAFRRGFFMGKFEVSWGQYVAFAEATGHPLPRPADSLPKTHPASGLNWFDAQAYCAWAGLKLPTEAQWEYAARSSSQHTYPWGEASDTTDLGNLRGKHDGFAGSSPVGYYPQGASPFGCLDMAGNVWEWTADWAGPLRGTHVLVEPTGAKTGTHRIVRGGSYRTTVRAARAGLRTRQDPHLGRPTTGFRVMLPAR